LKVQYNKPTGTATQYESDEANIGHYIPLTYQISPELKALWDKGEDGAVYDSEKGEFGIGYRDPDRMDSNDCMPILIPIQTKIIAALSGTDISNEAQGYTTADSELPSVNSDSVQKAEKEK